MGADGLCHDAYFPRNKSHPQTLVSLSQADDVQMHLCVQSARTISGTRWRVSRMGAAS